MRSIGQIVLFLSVFVPAYVVQAQCSSNIDCSFPSGICQAGACLCDGEHTGSTCADLTSGILHTLLQGGVWGICAISLVGGLLVGGVFRFLQTRLYNQREAQQNKGLMFGFGDVETFQSRNAREKKRRKKKKKKRAKDNGDEEEP